MASAEKILLKKLNARFAKKQSVLTRKAAEMGDGRGNLEVPNMDSFIYVRIGGKSVPVFNNRVANQIGTAIWVGYAPEEPTLLQVLSTRSDTPAGAETGYVGYAPARRYEWHANKGGQDPLSVHLRALTPLKLSVSDTVPVPGELLVNLYRGFVYSGTRYYAITRQDLDIAEHVPTAAGKAAFVLITIDSTGTIIQTKGDEVDIDALVITDIPDIPEDTVYVCGAVRVYTGQLKVQEGRTNTDFVDLRFTSAFGFDATIPWDHITGKPSVFPPDLDVTDPLYAGKHITNADPTVDDDDTGGLEKLDIWLNESTGAVFICTDNATGAAIWLPIGSGSPGDVVFKVDGSLLVLTSAAVPHLVTRDIEIEAWYIYCSDNGSASSTIVDVNKNGTTVFTTQSNRPTLAHDDADNWAISGTPEVIDFTEGDAISIDIDQIATDAVDLVIIGFVSGVGGGGGGGSFNLTVEDASVSVSNVGKITLPDGWVTDVGGGEVAISPPDVYDIASLASDQAVTTVADITGMTFTKTLVSGRRYRWKFSFVGTKTTTGTLTILITDGSNTQLEKRYVSITNAFGFFGTVEFTEVGAGSSVTRKVRASCDSGSFNFDRESAQSVTFEFEEILNAP